jgi:hypothetical protein
LGEIHAGKKLKAAKPIEKKPAAMPVGMYLPLRKNDLFARLGPASLANIFAQGKPVLRKVGTPGE